MMSDQRIGIILLASIVSIASTISIGTFLGFPFSQTVTILTLIGLAVTFSIGTEQIIRWTETDQTENPTMTGSVQETQNPQIITEEDTSKSDAGPSTEKSLFTSFKDDKEWKMYHDRGYEISRILSKFANQVGRHLYEVPRVTPSRV